MPAPGVRYHTYGLLVDPNAAGTYRVVIVVLNACVLLQLAFVKEIKLI